MGSHQYEYFVEKYPEDKWAIGFKFLPPDLDIGETLTACDVVVPSGLTQVGDAVIDNVNKTAAIVITGGTVNKLYRIKFKTTTSVGYIFVDEIVVRVI